MNPALQLLLYLLATAGGLAVILAVVFLYICLWFYLVGGAAKGRNE